jgi:hypothetical protein
MRWVVQHLSDNRGTVSEWETSHALGCPTSVSVWETIHVGLSINSQRSGDNPSVGLSNIIISCIGRSGIVPNPIIQV